MCETAAWWVYLRHDLRVSIAFHKRNIVLNDSGAAFAVAHLCFKNAVREIGSGKPAPFLHLLARGRAVADSGPMGRKYLLEITLNRCKQFISSLLELHGPHISYLQVARYDSRVRFHGL